MKDGNPRSEKSLRVADAEVAEDDANESFLFDKDGALSRDFLLRRGFCCKNGCKNCPYGFVKNHQAKGQAPEK